MSCNVQDIEYVAGDTFELSLTVYTSPTNPCNPNNWCCYEGSCCPQDQTPLNLTGATIYMVSATGSALASGTVKLWEISTITGDILISDATAGQLIVIIPSTATLSLVGTQLNSYYNLVVELPDDSVGKQFRQTVLRGCIYLQESILG